MIHIIACDEAPDNKIPWLLVVLIVPVVGFMLYFLFGDQKAAAQIHSLSGCHVAYLHT